MFKWLSPLLSHTKDALFGWLSGKSTGSTALIIFGCGFLVYYLFGIAFECLWLPNLIGDGVISFSPVRILLLGFSAPAYTLLLLVLAFISVVFFIRWNMYEVKLETGERHDARFINSADRTHGSAEWMRTEHLDSDPDLLYAPLSEAKGIILGMHEGKAVTQNPDGGLNKNILCMGISGSRKTTNFIIPYIYQTIDAGESIIAVDTKGEVYRATADYAYRNGYTVRLFNARDPENSQGFNPMKSVALDHAEADRLVTLIIESTKQIGDANDDPFWRAGYQNLLKTLILFVNEESAVHAKAIQTGAEVYRERDWNPRDGYGTIGRVSRILLDAKSDKRSAFAALSTTLQDFVFEYPQMKHHPFLDSWNAYASNSNQEVLSGIIGNLQQKLKLFQSPHACHVLGSDEIDLTLPGREKCIYYVLVNEMDTTNSMLSSVFFSELIQKLLNLADSLDGRCPVPVNLLMDEFGALGIIPNWGNVVSGARSRNIRSVMAFQNLDQIAKLYPLEYRTITANCAVWLGLKLHDTQTSRMFTEMMGKATIETHGTRMDRKTSAVNDYTDHYFETVANTGRELMDVSEMSRLPADELILHIEGKQPMILKKCFYQKMPQYLAGIESVNINRFRENDKELREKYEKEKAELPDCPKGSGFLSRQILKTESSHESTSSQLDSPSQSGLSLDELMRALDTGSRC